MSFHHVAFATKDLEATRHFYEDLFGFPLIHTEVVDNGDSWMKHIFFDSGDEECIAFFAFENIGEQSLWASDVSSTVGLPVWVNHVAFRASKDQQDRTRARMEIEGISPTMDIDHGWCASLYYLDPNGVLVELCRDTPGITRDEKTARRLLSRPIGQKE